MEFEYMFRKVRNKDSNEYNKESEFTELRYKVFETRGKRSLVARCGWESKEDQRWVDTDSLYIKEE